MYSFVQDPCVTQLQHELIVLFTFSIDKMNKVLNIDSDIFLSVYLLSHRSRYSDRERATLRRQSAETIAEKFMVGKTMNNQCA